MVLVNKYRYITEIENENTRLVVDSYHMYDYIQDCKFCFLNIMNDFFNYLRII